MASRLRQSVDSSFAARIVARAKSTTDLCKLDGGMTFCRGDAAASTAGKASPIPLTAHEEDSRRLLAECLAGKG